MKTFRSSPLIPHCINGPKRSIKKQSKLKQTEYKILNPFRSGQQQNFLPNQLISQIQDMEFISPTSIKKIKLNNSIQGQRHSSNFVNHLKMMQNAARQQQMKFNGMISSQNQKKVTFYQEEPQQRIINQRQHPMSIEQLDNLSMDMENCLHDVNYRDMDDNDFGLFGEGQENQRERQEYKNEGYFYSEHCIPHQTGNTDLDCYLND